MHQLLASLLPNFERETVLEDLRITRSEFKEVIEPAYEGAVQFLKGWDFKSDEVNDLFTSWKRIVKGAGNDNMYVTIHKGIDEIIKNLHEVEELIKKTFSEDIAGTGLTYMKGNLIQFVEYAGFVAKYARRFLMYTYIYETGKYEQGGTSVTESLTPAEKQWIEQNFVNFAMAFKAVSGNPGNVKKGLEEVPDIVATADNAHTLPHTVGEDKLDPLQMRFIPVWLNPIYHIRMRVAEWQTARYHASREELALLQLRLLNLKQTTDGKPDANVQKRIDVLEKRIGDLNYKITKMENDNHA
jgi:hypothetical protein